MASKPSLGTIFFFLIIIIGILFGIFYLCFGIYLMPPKFIDEIGFTAIYFRLGLSLGYIEIFNTVIKSNTVTSDNPYASMDYYNNFIKKRTIMTLPFNEKLYTERFKKWVLGEK